MSVVAAMTLAGCNTPARLFRERFTLVVDTPEGTATGSSVTEHSAIFQDGWWGGLSGHTRSFSTLGEATVVDLRERGLLFALLIADSERIRSSNPGGYEYRVFAGMRRRDTGGGDEEFARFIDILNRERPKGDIKLDDIGLLVRFRDPNDPKTVERVDPGNLAASFGAGVALARATVEIVKEPLTHSIDTRLPWLEHLQSSLDGDSSLVRRVPQPFANELGQVTSNGPSFNLGACC
jgi:hypothetical protein